MSAAAIPGGGSAALERLPSIGLEELLARAMLQTRVDRKYILPAGALGALLEQLPPGTRVLEIAGERGFAYRSLYFDTPDLLGYRLAALRRRRRFKVRTRLYEQSGECWLEVKTRGSRGSTVKQRLPYERDAWGTLAPGRHFVDEALAAGGVEGGRRLTLLPVLTTRYRRTTLHLPDSGSRVTIDTALTWQDGDRRLHLPDAVVVETKTGSTPSAVDRLLWRAGHRPSRISKYATGLAALRPDLPAVPWRRTLRRDFQGAEPAAGRLPAPAASAELEAAGAAR